MKQDFIESGGRKVAVSIYEPEQSGELAIILCPGYLDSQDYPHIVELGKKMAQAGILAVSLDATGIWRSEGGISDYSISRYLLNIEDMRNWIIKRYGVSRFMIVGHSLGGFISILYAETATVEAVIAICAPEKMLGTAAPNWQKSGTRLSLRDLPDSSGERRFDVPWSFATDSSRYSAISSVKNFRNVPILLIAGGKDSAIPVSEVKHIFDAALQPKQIVVFQDMEHNYRYSLHDVARVNETIVNWLQGSGFHLKPMHIYDSDQPSIG